MKGSELASVINVLEVSRGENAERISGDHEVGGEPAGDLTIEGNVQRLLVPDFQPCDPIDDRLALRRRAMKQAAVKRRAALNPSERHLSEFTAAAVKPGALGDDQRDPGGVTLWLLGDADDGIASERSHCDPPC